MAKKLGKSVSTKRKKKSAKQKVVRPLVSTGQQAQQSKQPACLPNVWQLTKTAWRILWQHKKLFIGITLIYGLLNLILVQGLASNTDVTSLKNTLNQAYTGHLGSVVSSLSAFAVLVSSAGNGSSQTAGAYQLFLGLVTSLAVIWTLRQVLARKSVRIRDAYYQGMYPLVPFILVLVIVGLQLIPLLVGSGLYSLVITNGIAVHVIEKILFAAAFAALAALSLYWVSSSLFALYIVTLPDMTPLKALRSARELVRRRRWMVLRKLLCLPVILLMVAAVIMVPIIILLTPLAQWVFFLLTMFALVAIHTYMYTLYRELLNE
jgi:hypothetical protein